MREMKLVADGVFDVRKQDEIVEVEGPAQKRKQKQSIWEKGDPWRTSPSRRGDGRKALKTASATLAA